jgi:hypothetical protein
MTTIQELIKIEQKINSHLQTIKQAEDESIREVLKFFGIPEEKEEGHKLSIKELLQKQRIYIVLHSSVYKKVDFTSFILPKRLIIESTIYADSQACIYGEDDYNLYTQSIPIEETKQSMLFRKHFPLQFKRD